MDYLLYSYFFGIKENFLNSRRLKNLNSHKKNKIVVICGPTGIGKTSAAIQLANAFNGEIISADSMQIYKYMDIGTAKPTAKEQKGVKHHMIDIIEPDEDFNAAIYSEMGGNKVYDLAKQNIPIFVAGGTGLYIKTLIYGIFEQNRSSMTIRKKIEKDASESGINMLYDRLSKVDPEYAEKINKNDRYRIIRALEIYESTGKKVSFYHNNHRFGTKRFATYKIGIDTNRETLYKRINIRVDDMINKGFVDEVKGLLEKGYSPELKSMQSIGYKHICVFLTGLLSLDEAVHAMKRDTRRYAKRQMTWFKADKEIIRTTFDKVFDLKNDIYNFLNAN